VNGRIEDLEDVKTWIASHDARINAWWESQHELNTKVEGCMKDLETKVSALEKKVMWIAGAASALGAVVGNIVLAVV
jgi:putative NADH-flavin reductase